MPPARASDSVSRSVVDGRIRPSAVGTVSVGVARVTRSPRASRGVVNELSVEVTRTRHRLPAAIDHTDAGRSTVTSVGRPGVSATRTGAVSERCWTASAPSTRQSETKSVASLPVEVTWSRTLGAPTTVSERSSTVLSNAADIPGRAARR